MDAPVIDKESSMNVWSRSAAWGALFFLCACGVAYDVGPHVDGGSTTQVNSGGQGGGLAPDSVAAPPPAVAIQGIPFACERWGKGNPLGGIAGLIAMENVAFLLWTAPEQQDQQKLALATEAIQTYLPLVETSGDLYCVALHMLENNRAVLGVSSFYRTWLGLDAYPEKDPVLFPGYDHDRLALMARDALDFLVDVTLRGDRNFQRLWTSERPCDPGTRMAEHRRTGPRELGSLRSRPFGRARRDCAHGARPPRAVRPGGVVL
ncbi:MAG: DUF1592 domain-containing protein [Myxococcales bacterium]|nr:DUF1592 domain-containing protein [Myxococcales bacterium]